ncbi:hypothetical protein LR48_Vigan07g233600 [Vigna angularis]|uniref:Uncharacterized protein n=1 Tax=Phaseolus angularis TaxID=3914 RepID=A0A0L9V1A4_PHAAN|nr:hypothetical protein LR48_Vigan07g233600 [Vigna angularis]
MPTNFRLVRPRTTPYWERLGFDTTLNHDSNTHTTHPDWYNCRTIGRLCTCVVQLALPNTMQGGKGVGEACGSRGMPLLWRDGSGH